MNAETMLKKIHQIAELYHPEIAETPEFQDLAQNLREEIALAEQKKAGRADRFKAALRLSKWVNREFRSTRPAMAGAYIDDKGAQWIFHSYIGVRYDKPYDGLVVAEEGMRPANAEKILATYDSLRPVSLPDVGVLKTKRKLDKAQGDVDDRGRSHTKLDGVYFDTDLLIKLMESVEPTEAYFSSKGDFPMLVAMGDGSRGVLCPIRVNG